MGQQIRGEGAGNPFLRRLRAQLGLGQAELFACEALLERERRTGPRREIVAEGTRPARLHVLLDGWACRFKLVPDGRRQITTLLVPGDICDISILYARTAHCAVSTLTDCTFATIDPARLRALGSEHEAIGEALARLAAYETAILAEHCVSLGRRSAREHLSHLLCELMIRLTAVGLAEPDGYEFLVTQEQMADVLGLTSVHVNRVLQVLRAEGLIGARGHKLVIYDLPGLQRAAAFRPDYLRLGSVADGVADGHRGAMATPVPAAQLGFS